MLRRVGSFVALIMVATLVLAACGEPDAKVKPTVTRIPVENAPVPPTETVAGAAASPEATGGTTSPGVSGAQTTFDIVMLDVEFDVKELTVPANTEITINLLNKGALNHTFDIKELGVDSGEYTPGQTGMVKFNSGAPAEYEFFCAVPGHRELGMVGKLIVAAEAAQPEPTPAEASPADIGSAGTAPGAPVTLDVAMQDISFSVTELTVPANSEITINLVNSGALTHTFDIDALKVHSGEYAAGQTGKVTFNSGAPAEYEYVCAIPGHRELGMVGKLIVAAEAAQPEPSPAESGATTAPAASPVASPGAPPAASPEASPPASPAALQTTFDVVMEDIKFDVTELTVPANTDITINLVNKGALTHNFSIAELSVDSGDYVGGQEGTVTFNSGPPAEYQFFCDIPGHKEIGMVGKLIVVDQSAGAGAAPASAPTGTASSASPPATAQTTFDVHLQDIQFDVTEMTVPANTEITLNLTNMGFGPHNLDIDALKVASGDLAAGETKTVTFNSGAPGTYEYYCSIPGHKQLGMVGKLIVQ